MIVEYLESRATNVIDEAEDHNSGENIERVEEGVVDKTVLDGEEARDNDHPKDSKDKLVPYAALPVIDDKSSLQSQSQDDVKAKELIGPPENPGKVDDAIQDAPDEAEDIYIGETDEI